MRGKEFIKIFELKLRLAALSLSTRMLQKVNKLSLKLYSAKQSLCWKIWILQNRNSIPTLEFNSENLEKCTMLEFNAIYFLTKAGQNNIWYILCLFGKKHLSEKNWL